MLAREETIKTLESVGLENVEKLLEVPPQPELGDLAFPCFELAKKEKRSPMQIAEEIAKKIKIPKGSSISRIEAKAGYVNFFFDYAKIAKPVLKNIIKQKSYGSSDIGKGKTFMIEFCHANTHKGFHIGHLRNICLGEATSRILEFSGHKIIRTNYQGDIGPHVAKCLWGFINLYNCKAPKENKGEWLGNVYSEANKKTFENETLEQEVREINKKLYEGDKGIVRLWKMTRKWCLEDFGKIYKELGVKFDKFYFESEVEKRGTEIAGESLKKGIAKMSEGAIVVDLTEYDLGVFVLLTKEDTPLYSTKDLGLAEKQFKDFKIDKVIHVVGVEQKLYFQQLFKTFGLTGSPAANKSQHLIYELVNLKTGKMSSRLGSVVLYSELKKKIIEKVLGEIEKRNPKMLGKEKLAKAIGLGALKYGMLGISPEKVIVFDWEEALRLEGNTGPYLQYAHTRCSGILKKAGKWKPNFNIEKLEEQEKELIKFLMNFSEIAGQSAKDMKPNYICNYAFDLATAFDKFYEACPVLKAENKKLKEFRLTLVSAAKNVLKNSLNLLGIEPLEKM